MTLSAAKSDVMEEAPVQGRVRIETLAGCQSFLAWDAVCGEVAAAVGPYIADQVLRLELHPAS